MFLRRLSKTLVGLAILCSAWGAEVQGSPLENKENRNKEAELLAPLEFGFAALPNDVKCYLDVNGYFTISIFNPDSMAYSFEIRNTSNVIVDSGIRNVTPFNTSQKLAAGAYTIFIKEISTGLQKNTSQNIGSPGTISLSGIVNSPTCSNGTGEIKLTATGGNGGFKYYLNYGQPGEVSNDHGVFPSLPRGSYSAVVFDGKGCPGTYEGSPLTITIPNPINLSYTILSEITCYNNSATVQINGVPTDASISIINNRTNNTNYSKNGNVFYGLDYGSYTVTAKRSACTSGVDDKQITFDIEKFDKVSMSFSKPSPNNDILCSGGKTTIDVKVDGGKTSSKMVVRIEDSNSMFSLTSTPLSYGSTWTFTDIVPGTYLISWIDQNNALCNGDTAYTVSGPASPLKFDGEPYSTQAPCNGVTYKGRIIIPVSGGKTPYNYMVAGVSESNPGNIERPAGSYEVYVIDANNCETSKKIVTVKEPDALSVLNVPFPNTNVTCPGGSDGEIHLSFSGGNGGYRYNMTGTETRVNQSADSLINYVKNLKAGNYSFTFSDKNGCTAPALKEIKIEQPEPIKIDQFTIEPIKCYGGTTQLNVKAGGGASNSYKYQLFLGNVDLGSKTGSAMVSFDKLTGTSALYKLTIWSNETCPQKDTTFTIEPRKKLEVEVKEVRKNGVFSIVNHSFKVSCPDDAGVVRLNVKGEKPFRYKLNGGAFSAEFTDSVKVDGLMAALTGANNSITIFDKNDCDTTLMLQVFEPAPLKDMNFQRTHVFCKGESTGAVKFFMTGGTPGYTATLGNLTFTSNDTIRFNNLAAANYKINVTDDNGCDLKIPVTFDIEEPPVAFDITNMSHNPAINCFGDETNLLVTASGGWGGSYTVRVTGTEQASGNPIDITNKTDYKFKLKGGEYTVVATSDQYGCKVTKDYKIDEPKKLTVEITDSSDVSCFGFNDARLTFKASGGTLPYKYGLNGVGSATNPFVGNSDTHTINGGLVANQLYQVFVRDAKDCSSNVAPVKFSEPERVTFKLKADSVVCHGENSGKIEVTAMGGTPGYTYVVTYPDGTIKNQPNNGLFTNLLYGTYKVEVKDQRNCEAVSRDTMVYQPHDILITNVEILDSITCADSTNARIQITATGGEEYGLQYGISGRNYQLSPILTKIGPGNNYTVSVQDGRGKCKEPWPQTISLVEPKRLTASHTITDVACYDQRNGSITITPDGGSGQKTYWLFNSAGNPIEDNLSGKFYNLGNFNADRTVNTSVEYKYQVVDSKKCLSKLTTFSVKNPAELTIKEVDHHQVKCNDESNGWIKVEVAGGNGGYTFRKDYLDAVTTQVETISNNTYRITNYAGGTFRPMVIDSKNCSDTISPAVKITNPPKLEIIGVDKGIKKCYTSTDDATLVKAVGGTGRLVYSLYNTQNPADISQWYDSLFVNEQPGFKMPWVKDTEGCIAKGETFAFNLNRPDSFTVAIDKDEITCYYRSDGKLNLQIRGGTSPYYYSLNDKEYKNAVEIKKQDASQIVVPYEQANLDENIQYTFFLKDANDCPLLNRDVQTIYDPFYQDTWSRPDSLILDSITAFPVSCEGDLKGKIAFTIRSDVDSKLKFWVENQMTNQQEGKADVDSRSVIKLNQGTYNCYVSDQNGCRPYIDGNKDYLVGTIGKVGDSLKVFIVDTQKPFCNQSRNGSITIKVEDFSFGGFYYELMKVNSFGDYQVIHSDSVKSEDARKYMAEDGEYYLYAIDDNKVDFKLSVGDHRIFVVDSVTDCKTLVDFELLSEHGDSCGVVKNSSVITPNGDGINDYWSLSNIERFSNFDLKIYSAFGELVYKIDGKNGEVDEFQWYGEDMNGRPLPAGTYLWIRKDSPSSKPEYGTITIFRATGK